jgi:hypothetical protein
MSNLSWDIIILLVELGVALASLIVTVVILPPPQPRQAVIAAAKRGLYQRDQYRDGE